MGTIKISKKTILYMMIKKWGIILAAFIVTAGISFGIMMIRSKTAIADSRNTLVQEGDTTGVTSLEVNDRTDTDLEGYKSYIDNSAYMNIDPNNYHLHYLYYYINWKGQELSSTALEEKYQEIYNYVSAYYPSDEFVNEVIKVNKEYEKRALYDVVFVGKTSNRLSICIQYTDDYYVKDLCETIKLTINNKLQEWCAAVGQFELESGPETDRTGDAFLDGVKTNQDKKIAAFYERQIAAGSGIITSNTAKEMPAKGVSTVIKLLVSVIIGLLCGFIVGIILTIFGKTINTSDDVIDLIGCDVACIIKGEGESRLDKWFYKKNDKYVESELFLSLLMKKMKISGINRLLVYSFLSCDTSQLFDAITKYANEIETRLIPKECRNELYLRVKEDEAVILLVKKGETLKQDYLDMMKHINLASIRCEGTVLAL